MRFFYVEPSNIRGSQAMLVGSEAAHAKNVLRLRCGAVVGLLDGVGFEYSAVIESMPPGRVELSIKERRTSPGESPVRLILAQAFLKEKKMDRLVRQLSELGVARWIPFICERAVARPGSDRSETRSERWRKVAIESLKQCRRGSVMEIGDAARLDQMLEQGRSCDVRVFFWEKALEPLTLECLGTSTGLPSSIMVVVGPEGGFTEAEAEAAQGAGFIAAGLGPRILRAETATVTACALVQYLLGDLGPRQKILDKK